MDKLDVEERFKIASLRKEKEYVHYHSWLRLNLVIYDILNFSVNISFYNFKKQGSDDTLNDKI